MTIENRKANYDYFIEDKIECGISLKGNEVKSIHNGMCNIKDSWCQIQNGNLVVRGMHITPWITSNSYDIDVDREVQLVKLQLLLKMFMLQMQKIVLVLILPQLTQQLLQQYFHLS